MYCSGCGTEINAGLNYCNRCGSPVTGAEKSTVAENLSQAMGYIGGFGFFGFIFVIFLLVRAGIAPGLIIAVSALYLGALIAVCYMVLQQTSPFTSKRKRPAVGAVDIPEPAYLRPITTAQLPEQMERPASVTENTTRTLDEVPAGKR